jgi:hypothetical protein
VAASESELEHILLDPSAYVREIERLVAMRSPRQMAALVESETEIPAVLYEERRSYARALTDTLRDNSQALFSPARVGRVLLDKERCLYSFAFADRLVHALVASELTARLEPRLSPNVHSFRRGYSVRSALRLVDAYRRRLRRAETAVKRLGLWVFRWDIKSYGDTIDCERGGKLWNDVLTLLTPAERESNFISDLLERLLMPEVTVHPRPTGVPTGSPLVPLIENLYLSPQDHALSTIPGALYLRYGDDCLLAHPDPETLAQAQRRVDDILLERGLCINRAKSKTFFWNGARDQAVDFLGLRVHFNGGIRLNPDKHTAFLGDMKTRLRQTWRLAPDVGLLCRVANQLLDPASQFANPYTTELLSAVDDRTYLRELDLKLVQEIASIASGVCGVRAFRRFPPRLLYERYGLRSLVAERNSTR